ncbi:MAG: lipid-A-disaccharide synthase [Bacteroidales bacterium]|jgi:lipid-A-disaccharide synthase|nr:lipid-A-disaccharide synthase [Bacteroidales bacterium]
MKYYIIAGEASGDLHGSNLMKGIKNYDSSAEFRVWGGDKMCDAGGDLVKHYKEHSFMGLVPVIKNIRTIKANFKLCEEDLKQYKPDVLILIDYSGFNLRVAKFAKAMGLKIFYYISPQVWAWRKGRVKTIKQLIDKMFVILPFEKEFYASYGYDVKFVGHPLLDAIEEYKKNKLISKSEFIEKYRLSEKPVIAILPGSRKQEIKEKLPEMLGVVSNYKDYQFVIAAAPSIDESYYRGFISEDDDVKLIFDDTYNILNNSTAALVTSGTATLETALFKVPEVVCYRGGALSYYVVKYLVDIKFISIVNLIMDRQVVKELIQYDLNRDNIIKELDKILNDKTYRDKMLTDYDVLATKLGGVGASERAASVMIEELEK